MGRVVIIGGGIAGLSVASALARRRRDVLLLERGARLAGQSSAKSASMFRQATAEPINVQLATRSRELAELVAPGFLKAVGGLYLCGSEDEQRAILAASGRAGVVAATRLPGWLTKQQWPAVWSPGDGVMDVDRLVEALAADARRHGAVLQCDRRVERIETAGGRASGVLVNGELIPAEVVVDAAGAWSEQFPGAPTLQGVFRTRRRHLFLLEKTASQVESIVWDLGGGLYVRPHPEGVVASVCDESEVPLSEEIATDPAVEDLLREKLLSWAPSLWSRVLHRWAGLRPMSKDFRFLVGPDASLPGLFRVTGFGGHGMSAGLAAGEIAAQLLCGELPALATELDPRRFARQGVGATTGR